MKNMALILAGGRGKRFWPHSRFHKPKQLLKSPSGNTMLRDTFERLLPYFDTDDIYIATIEDLIQPIREMLPEIDMLNYIVEPTGRDTAASIALSALLISRYRHQDANLAIFPIDHYITEKEKFFNALNKGFQTVQQFKKPVIIGIRPSQNETRYGYICAGENVAKNGKEQIYQVETFKEKPEIEWIEENKKNHELFWNTGIYIFPGGLILELIKKWMPKLDRAINKIAQSIGTLEKG